LEQVYRSRQVVAANTLFTDGSEAPSCRDPILRLSVRE
jgi:hypothetical protein